MDSLEHFLFQVLVSGTSEEILFRAFLLVVIELSTRGFAGHQRLIRVGAVVISALTFMAGHVGVDVSTFAIISVNWLQQLTCLVVSLFYCWAFFRYRNIYSVMVTHNLINGIIILVSVAVFVTYPLPTPRSP